jgi:hypothetical protein
MTRGSLLNASLPWPVSVRPDLVASDIHVSRVAERLWLAFSKPANGHRLCHGLPQSQKANYLQLQLLCTLQFISPTSSYRQMLHNLSCLPTVAVRVRARIRSCGICGGQSGTGASFLRVLRFTLSILIPSIAPQSPSSVIWGWYNRPALTAVPSELSLTPTMNNNNNNTESKTGNAYRAREPNSSTKM